MAASPWCTDEGDNSNKNIFKKRRKQSKLDDIDSIYKHFTKTAGFQDISKESLVGKINNLVLERKSKNKINRKKDSFHLNKDFIKILSENEEVYTSNFDCSFSAPRIDKRHFRTSPKLFLPTSLTTLSLQDYHMTETSTIRQINLREKESLYIALFIFSGSLKTLFSIDCVSINLFSIFFQQILPGRKSFSELIVSIFIFS